MISEEKRAYNRAYYQQNREKLIAAERARYHADVDRTRATGRARYAANPEKFRAVAKRSASRNKPRRADYNSKYHAKHKEQIASVNKKWRQVNREKVLQNNRRYRKQRPDLMRLWAKKWISKNPHKQAEYDARRRALEKPPSVQEQKAIDAFYKFVRSKTTIPCYYCGKVISGKEAHIDHVVALSKSGNHATENLCVACPTCNHSKSNKSLKDWDRHDQKFLPL
jgi:5-methylcytosine-specific restriction endonuclease McrA